MVRLRLSLRLSAVRTSALPTTYMLSQQKYQGLLSWAEYGLTPILLVSWQDAIGYVRLPCPHDIAVGGRRDRGDALDIEPVVHIKTSDFKVILDL
jgi:hypothetical protein